MQIRLEYFGDLRKDVDDMVIEAMKKVGFDCPHTGYDLVKKRRDMWFEDDEPKDDISYNGD